LESDVTDKSRIENLENNAFVIDALLRQSPHSIGVGLDELSGHAKSLSVQTHSPRIHSQANWLFDTMEHL
jgi:hypothetical protein